MGSGTSCFCPFIIGLTLSKNFRSSSVISNDDVHCLQLGISRLLLGNKIRNKRFPGDRENRMSECLLGICRISDPTIFGDFLGLHDCYNVHLDVSVVKVDDASCKTSAPEE